MGKPDTITKEYMRRPDIFADVFNKFLYHGRQKILPEMLSELDTTEIAVPYGADDALVPEQRYRDVAKLLAAMTDGRTASEREEKINRCVAIREIREEVRLEGEVIGVIRTDRRRGIPQCDTRRYIMEEYLKSKEEVDELMDMYWQ